MRSHALIRLGEKIFEEDKGHFWGITETRPYMRAKAGHARLLIYKGKINKAIEIYHELLELNPNDNQGIRYEIMPLLLQQNRLKEYKKISQEYPEQSAFYLYNQTLYNYKKYGGVKKTTNTLRKAIKENPHVIAYLLDEREMPEKLPDTYGIGDESEAIMYIDQAFEAWMSNSKAMEWLYSFWQRYKNSN